MSLWAEAGLLRRPGSTQLTGKGTGDQAEDGNLADYGYMPDTAALRPGDPDELGGYRILSRLGWGGQGVVYLGTGSTGEQVAIKQVWLEDERDRSQFAMEVTTARRVAPFCTGPSAAEAGGGRLNGRGPPAVPGPAALPALRRDRWGLGAGGCSGGGLAGEDPRWSGHPAGGFQRNRGRSRR